MHLRGERKGKKEGEKKKNRYKKGEEGRGEEVEEEGE